MRSRLIIICGAVLLGVFVSHCGKSGGPEAPEMTALTQETGDAVLMGTVISSGAHSLEFGQIAIRVKNTGLQTHPDQNGDFRLNNLPTGDIYIEVNVQKSLSELELAQVRSREEIQARIEINNNNAARWCHLERNRNSQGTLSLEIRPNKWNTNWINSTDEVQARISGNGFETIVPELIVIKGPNGELTYPDCSCQFGGNFFKAFFSQQQAIALLIDPQIGDKADIRITGTNEDGSFDLSEMISVVGKKSKEDTGPLTVKVKPDKWNTNWEKSEGHVTVQVRGEGFADIMGETVRMSYGANEIMPEKWAFSPNHFAFKFAKKDAIGLFQDPKCGELYEITVSGELSGQGLKSTSYVIEIVGKK